MYDLVLRDATVVSPRGRQVADVAIQDGVIRYVGPRPPRAGREEVAVGGRFLLPGLVDAFAEGTLASARDITTRALRTGVTSWVLGAKDAGEGLSALLGSAELPVDWGFWGSQEWSAPAERPAGQVGRCLGPAAVEAVDWIDLEGPVLVACTAQAMPGWGGPAREALHRRGARGLWLLNPTHPDDLALLDTVRGPPNLHAVFGQHHLFLEGDPDSLLSPPLGDEDARRGRWALVRRGRVAALTGGHTAALSGSELLLPLALSAVRAGRLTLESLVALTSEGPARWLELPNKGRIERGADADLVLVGEAEVGRIVPDLVGAVHPYADREVGLWPELVLKGGRVVARRGKLQDGPAGRPLIGGPDIHVTAG